MNFTHTSSALGLPAHSELRDVSWVEGQWKAHEGREKFSRSIRALGKHSIYSASARSFTQWSMSLLLMNLLPGPELFDRS